MAMQPDLSDEQRANLTKLAAYLRTLPADYQDFTMSAFSVDANERAHVVCGTAACAVGHGPKAGIDPLLNEDWEDYSERVFVPIGAGNNAWDWCFSSIWTICDNTIHGAAARIEWMLANGVPDGWLDQAKGRVPLCYLAGSL